MIDISSSRQYKVSLSLQFYLTEHIWTIARSEEVTDLLYKRAARLEILSTEHLPSTETSDF